MADKSTFTPDEWTLLLESVMTAGIAVTAAEPSGIWGMLKESFASSSVLLQSRSDATASPLIRQSSPTSKRRQGEARRVMDCRPSSREPNPRR